MLVEINDNISLIVSELGFMYCNCILIKDDCRTIIDTGADTNSLLKINPDEIDLILYTHHHYDHTRGHSLFKNSKTLIHRLDFPATQNVEAIELYNSTYKWEELMPAIAKEEGLKALNMLPDMRMLWSADGTFEDNNIFDLGKTKVQVIHTPGHSAGHSSFWFPEEEFLFTGDICLTAAGPWYGELYADPDDMIKSIDKIIALKPNKIASCHINSVYNNDITKILNEFKNRIFKRDERIYNFLKEKPADIHKLADNKLIYRHHPSPFVVFWEKLMLIKHLARLEKMDMIEEVEPNLFHAK